MPHSRVVLKRTIVQYKAMIVEHGENLTDLQIGRRALEMDNGQGYEARDGRFQRRTHSVEPISITGVKRE